MATRSETSTALVVRFDEPEVVVRTRNDSSQGADWGLKRCDHAGRRHPADPPRPELRKPDVAVRSPGDTFRPAAIGEGESDNVPRAADSQDPVGPLCLISGDHPDVAVRCCGDRLRAGARTRDGELGDHARRRHPPHGALPHVEVPDIAVSPSRDAPQARLAAACTAASRRGGIRDRIFDHALVASLGPDGDAAGGVWARGPVQAKASTRHNTSAARTLLQTAGRSGFTPGRRSSGLMDAELKDGSGTEA